VELFAGTSGYSYKEWKGAFYPEDLPPADFLRFYASRFGTVEVNNTFYRMPKKSVVAAWAKDVPDAFTFVLKASKRITHIRKLKDAQSEVAYFFEVAGELGGKLGPSLFQLPPFQRKDKDRLAAFLDLLPKDRKTAFEFRHPSWFDEEIYALLRAHGASLCFSDTEDEEENDEEDDADETPWGAAAPPQPEPMRPIVPTAEFGYFRLRRCDYTRRDLAVWAERMKGQPWKSVYVFFKHEEDAGGPTMAAEFQQLFNQTF
jgi:uncharacterized protein YecE (DUF72 family)